MRRPLGALLAVVAVGVALFVVLALTRGTDLAYTLGVPNNAVAAAIGPGRVVCQTPIQTPAGTSFDRIVVTLGTYGRPGPELHVGVNAPQGHVSYAKGTLPGGYADITRQPRTTIRLDRTVRARDVSICFRNAGLHRVAFYGSGDASTPSTADIDIVLERPHRSWASQLGSVARRATLFRWPHPPGWLYVALLCLLGLGALAGLAAAVRSAADEDPEDDLSGRL
jgi:hypothetical protein